MFDEPEYPAPPFEYAKGCTMQEVAPNDYVLRVPIGTRTGRQQDALGSTGASVTVEYYEPATAPESQPALLSPERAAEIVARLDNIRFFRLRNEQQYPEGGADCT